MSPATPTKTRLTAQQAAERYVHPPSPADVADIVDRALAGVSRLCPDFVGARVKVHASTSYQIRVIRAAVKELEALGYKVEWRPSGEHAITGHIYLSWKYFVKHPTYSET